MVDLSLLAPLVGVELLLKGIALVDLYKRPATAVKGGRKWVWALAIIFITTASSVAYLVWGRSDDYGE